MESFEEYITVQEYYHDLRENEESTSYNEEALCGRPCGQEPYGCYECPELGGN